MPSFERLRIEINGAVQGVGFRPFVFRLATRYNLNGWVQNSPQGVIIEVEGPIASLSHFRRYLSEESPEHAYIQSLETSHLDRKGYSEFKILHSENSGEKKALVLPDLATCPQCLQDISDPTNRRYQYPFTNCTLCGPRYSIIESLPYDRANTSMRSFQMCDLCMAEYQDPTDRRFHAQPNACPECGPQLVLWNSSGKVLATRQEALAFVVDLLLDSKIVAVKGIGGFHLLVNAENGAAIDELRRRKKRSEKPFAVMVGSLELARQYCEINTMEASQLSSPAAPIIILDRKMSANQPTISQRVAPGNPTIGLMIPYTPLHYLLLNMVKMPLIATSGNISDEPICADEAEALEALEGIADFFLIHNRPIVRPVDDSILRVVKGREMILRRSRGFAPLPVSINNRKEVAIAVGAHQKNAIALQIGENAFISQHVGDLETSKAFGAFTGTVSALKIIFDVSPDVMACDLHPDYLSTQYAKNAELPLIQIQHHYAHILSCMAENQLEGTVLGVAWDGTGYGPDGTVWGGEFLKTDKTGYQRVAHFRPFPLPGGASAIKDPKSAALGMLYEIYGNDTAQVVKQKTDLPFSDSTLELKIKMMERSFNSPRTSSVGRIFDAVAALIGLRTEVTFEGQAAMELEAKTALCECSDYYPFDIVNNVDWKPLIECLLEDVINETSEPEIAAKFHNTLTQIIVAVAKNNALPKIVLSGGCFQNKYLTENAISALSDEGFQPYWHQRVPPNDGGIALGQLAAVESKDGSD